MPIEPKKIVKQLPAYPRPDEGRYDKVRLDFNENTAGFPSAYPPGLQPVTVSAYPEYSKLIDKIASVYQQPANSIMITNGSDEGLFITAHTFIEPGEDKAVVSTPCFVVIPHCLKLAGAEVTEIAVCRDDLSFDIPAIEEALRVGAKIAMFATPENPTGAILAPETVAKWCQEFPNTLFAIDEAYGEYCESTMMPYTAKFDNLLVYRTFSKAWGMAGLRLGVVIGNPKLLEYMHVVKMPFSVNSAAVATALKLLDSRETVVASAKDALREKDRLVVALTERGYTFNTGHSNSILLNAGAHAGPLTEYCRSKGVLIRNRSNERFPSELNGRRPVMWGKVRVSVGTSEETNQFLSALDEFNSQYAVMFDLDGTLIDVTSSYDLTVHTLFERHAGRPLKPEELTSLRAEGGFNDDWEGVQELLRREGIQLDLAQIAREGMEHYMSEAHKNEKLLCEIELIERIARRHPTFVITGRTRPEYDPLWASRLDRLFREVYCMHDLPGKRAKPHADYLEHVLQTHKFKSGVYIGNAVDDMMAGKSAGLDAIGVTTTQPAEVLKKAGADLTLPGVEFLAEVFMV